VPCFTSLQTGIELISRECQPSFILRGNKSAERRHRPIFWPLLSFQARASFRSFHVRFSLDTYNDRPYQVSLTTSTRKFQAPTQTALCQGLTNHDNTHFTARVSRSFGNVWNTPLSCLCSEPIASKRWRSWWTMPSTRADREALSRRLLRWGSYSAGRPPTKGKLGKGQKMKIEHTTKKTKV